MSKLLLHIGLHKTGTTYLQADVWPNWDDIIYLGRGGSSEIPQLITNISKRYSEHVYLYSNEGLSSSPENSTFFRGGGSWLKDFKKRIVMLSQIIPKNQKTGIIMSLRRPESWVLSIYKHYLRFGGVDSIENFFGVGNKSATIQIEDLLIAPRISHIKKVMGVTPFCFLIEETSIHPHILANDLRCFARVNSLPEFPDSVYNVGLNAAEARVATIYNRMITNYGCVAQGYIQKKSGRGATLAKRISQLGLLSRKKLELSPLMSDFLKKNLSEDWEALIPVFDRSRHQSSLELIQKW